MGFHLSSDFSANHDPINKKPHAMESPAFGLPGCRQRIVGGITEKLEIDRNLPRAASRFYYGNLLVERFLTQS